jgi:AAA+ superfamily predicted ATPase
MLFSQMQLGVPAIWFKTLDVYRAQELILSFTKRDYYTIHPKNGFCKFVDGKWKPVLVQLPNPENPQEVIERIAHDFSVVWPYLKDLPLEEQNKVSFISLVTVKPDHLMTMFAGVIASAHEDYRNAFWKDDLTNLPMQFIFVSTFDVPEGYSSFFYSHTSDCPDKDELALILRHIDSSTSGTVFMSSKEDEIIRAGLGLSESSFINLCLTSVIEKGSLDPDYIYSCKMKEVKEKGILEIIRPKITFDQIGGLDNIKNLIISNARLWNNPSIAEQFGVTPISRILMVGVPGTGKSAICEATASALNLDLARTGVSQIMNSFVGQSEANMRAVFRQIKIMAPLCVWIDELGRDLSGGASSSHVDGGTTDRVHGEFLTGLQELPSNVFLMCAANQIDSLRPEMLRAERFDKIIFVGLPTFAERISIFKIYLNNMESSHNFDYERLAQATMYFTGAEIKSLVKEVKFNIALNCNRSVATDDIIEFIPKIRNVLWNKNRQMIKDLYSTALEQWDWASEDQFNDARNILSGTSRGSHGSKSETKSNFSWNSK